jgi:hypothetical protein
LAILTIGRAMAMQRTAIVIIGAALVVETVAIAMEFAA